MEKITEYKDLLYKISYINISSTIQKSLLDVEDFKLEYNISSKSFKHVESKIIFHFLFLNILKYLRSADKIDSFKISLYTDSKEKLNDVTLKQLKILKKILPIPIFIALDEQSTFTGLYGGLKELNNKVINFYQKRRVKLKELKKYLDNKGFNTISNTLSSVVDLKGFYY